jgi:hypothetical protein
MQATQAASTRRVGVLENTEQAITRKTRGASQGSFMGAAA